MGWHNVLSCGTMGKEGMSWQRSLWEVSCVYARHGPALTGEDAMCVVCECVWGDGAERGKKSDCSQAAWDGISIGGPKVER